MALGHIHKQQCLDKEKRVWYAGTPIAVSFDESYSGNEHGVLMVECEHRGAAVSVESIPVKNINPLVNLPFEGAAEWEDVKKMLADYDSEIPSFVRLNVEVDGYLPAGANDEAQQIVADKKCRLCLINSKRKVLRDHATSDQPTLTATELKQIDFIEVAKMYIESEGVTFDDEMLEMLQEVKEMLNLNQE